METRLAVISMEGTTRAADVGRALEANAECTGIISTMSFRYIKDTLEKRPREETRRYDVIVFDMTDKPALVHRKPIYFCKWDGQRMGEMGMETLLRKGKPRQRVTYLPMWIYPPALRRVLAFLPFRGISYTPVALYVGAIPLDGALAALGIQLAWVVILAWGSRRVYAAAMARLAIQGG